MKVNEVVANFPPYFGGIGNACLAYSLELINNGDEVEVYTSNYPDRPYNYPNGLKVNRLKYQFKYGNAPLTLGLFKMKRDGLVHLHYPYYFGAEIILLLAKFGRVKYVVTYHMDMVGSGVLRQIFSLHKRLFLGPVLRNAERIFVTSNDYAEHSDLVNVPGIKDKIRTIPLGVDLKRFRPRTKNSALRKKNNIPSDAQVVLMVGGLDRPHYFKGVPILLEAFAQVSPDAHLILAGDGELKNEYQRQAKQFGISKRIHFAGRVNDDDLPHYYNLCDVFVLPSIDKVEAFGMVLLEAMASAKPIIASNLPGVRSLVSVGKNGYTVEPSNIDDLAKKLNNILSNKKRLLQFGKQSLSIAEKRYSWEVVGKQLYDELRKVAS